MSGIDKIVTDTNKRALLIAAFIVFVAWWLCLIIIPAFPNGACPAFGTPGASGGSSGGGTTFGGTCPVCPTCDEPQRPANYCGTTSQGVPIEGFTCPIGGYDTGMNTCRCGTGSYWNLEFELCCPSPVGGFTFNPLG